MRDVSLNTTDILALKNPRDSGAIYALARQMFPTRLKFFQNVFFNATKRPYSYLHIALGQEIDEDMRLRTNILPDEEEPLSVWMPQ